MTHKLTAVAKAVEKIKAHLKCCRLCPRNCGINRLENNGFCLARGEDAIVYTYFCHRGEEPGISGPGGSGTIFFSGCNLKCVYCQNFKFSHSLNGKKHNTRALADIMLKLQSDGADNINLVTPTHFLPQILKALEIALCEKLKIPVIYNCSGYEKKEIIRLLEGIIDIYLCDIKYYNPEIAAQFSQAPDYFRYCADSLRRMYRQQPKLEHKNEIINRGLIIRHLVLPNHIDNTQSILKWIKNNTPAAGVSVMFQYQPYFKASDYPAINRPINQQEYERVKSLTDSLGLNGWIQDLTPQEDMAGPYFKPD